MDVMSCYRSTIITVGLQHVSWNAVMSWSTLWFKPTVYTNICLSPPSPRVPIHASVYSNSPHLLGFQSTPVSTATAPPPRVPIHASVYSNSPHLLGFQSTSVSTATAVFKPPASKGSNPRQWDTWVSLTLWMLCMYIYTALKL